MKIRVDCVLVLSASALRYDLPRRCAFKSTPKFQTQYAAVGGRCSDPCGSTLRRSERDGREVTYVDPIYVWTTQRLRAGPHFRQLLTKICKKATLQACFRNMQMPKYTEKICNFTGTLLKNANKIGWRKCKLGRVWTFAMYRCNPSSEKVEILNVCL